VLRGSSPPKLDRILDHADKGERPSATCCCASSLVLPAATAVPGEAPEAGTEAVLRSGACCLGCKWWTKLT
jgi:hypothetical protein